MKDRVQNFISDNIKTYHRDLDSADILKITDKYCKSFSSYFERELIFLIEDYEMKKNTSSRSQQEKEDVKNWRSQRRRSVYSENIYPDSFEHTVYPKDKETVDFLDRTMVGDIPFGFLNPRQKRKLIETMWRQDVEPNTILIKEGETDNRMYIVEEGKFDVLQKGKVINKLTRGSYFGEIALLHNVARTATVKSTVKSSIWVVEQENFLSIRASDRNIRKKRLLEGLVKTKIFPDLSVEDLEVFVTKLTYMYFNTGEEVKIKEDEFFMVIYEGRITCDGEERRVEKYDVLYNDFMCNSVIEGAHMKKKFKKLHKFFGSP